MTRTAPMASLMAAASLAASAGGFSATTSSFTPGAAMPARLATPKVEGGADLSPAVAWANPPAGVKSFAITCVDKHAMARNWVHWMVVNIPASCSALPEGASRSKMPKGAVELRNTFGYDGWGGPQPPPGSGKHVYVVTVYALDIPALSPSKRALSESELKGLLEGHVLAAASFQGFFER